MRALLTLVVGSVLLLAGCSDGDGPDAEPSGSPATSQSTSPSTDTTGIEPATGPLVEDENVSYHLPEGIEWDLGLNGFSANAYDEELNPFDIGATVVPLQAGNDGTDLDRDYDSSAGDLPYEPPLKRGENRVVDGVEGWTAQTVDDGQLVYAFGTMHDRVSFDIIFSFPKKDPRSVEWIDAILASIQWK